MLIIIQIILEIFGEALLEFGPELFVEIILHSRRAGSGQPCNWFFASIGYFLLGLLIGGASLLLFPHSFIHLRWLRLVNLIVSPLLSALLLMLAGFFRARAGEMLIRLDRFGYAYLCAFSIALVRFVWAI